MTPAASARRDRSLGAGLARWLCLALLCAARTAWAQPPEPWLIAIGDDHGEAGDEPLRYAERDAQLVTQTLEQDGGLSALRVTQLLGSSAEQVRAALQEVNARIRTSGRPAMLIVFYSGHADADALHLDGTELQLDELKNLVTGSPAAMRLLIVDACRSGAVTRVKGVRPAPPLEPALTAETSTEGLAIITSSTAGESSQESDALRGSFFTHHFVNALRGAADENGDGQVTLSEAYAYAYSQTLRSSGRTLLLQHPTYSYDVKGKGEVVLSRPLASSGRVGRLVLPEVASYLISEQREGGPVVAEVSPVRAGATLALLAGKYFVQERLRSEYREYEVAIAPGAETPLEGAPYRAIRYDLLVRKGGGERRFLGGVYLLGGVHGPLLAGDPPGAQAVLGAEVDTSALTLGLRVRGATSTAGGPDGYLPRRHNELGVGISLQRFVDYPGFSAAFGLLVEGTLHSERTFGPRGQPALDAYGAGFAGSLALERQLGGGFAVRVEGGPVTYLFREQTVGKFNNLGTTLASPFTYWADGGIVWRY